MMSLIWKLYLAEHNFYPDKNLEMKEQSFIYAEISSKFCY